MQALKNGYLHGSVSLSTEVKGRTRKEPVWELRYRLPSGKDSRRILAKAWTKKSRPPAGYLTKSQVEAVAQRFLDDNAESVPEDRKTFGRACDEFLAFCEHERGLRGSTMHEYRRIAQRLCERPWRGDLCWRERPLDTFAGEDLKALRRELVVAGRCASTINQYRVIVRGAFGKREVAEHWAFMVERAESSGKLHFYEPAQVTALKDAAMDDQDRAIFTLATEAGPRRSEILGLKISNVDFQSGILRFEDGFTEHGGHAGTKGHKVRSVPMTDNVRAALWPFCANRPTHDEDGEPTLVFEAIPGKPLDPSALYRRFRSAIKRAGLPKIKFHELRHSFGTQVMASGKVDVYTLQRLMGHESIQTTMKYLHYKPDPDLGMRLSEIWESDQPGENVVPFRKTA